MSDDRTTAVLSRYLAGEIIAEAAADLLGPGVSVSEVVLATRERFGRLPDRDDDFTRGEFQRALRLLGLAPAAEQRRRTPET